MNTWGVNPGTHLQYACNEKNEGPTFVIENSILTPGHDQFYRTLTFIQVGLKTQTINFLQKYLSSVDNDFCNMIALVHGLRLIGKYTPQWLFEQPLLNNHSGIYRNLVVHYYY